MSYSGTITADYGGFWRRVGAALIDGVILWLVQQGLSPILGLFLPQLQALPDPNLQPDAFWQALWPFLLTLWIIATVPRLIYEVGMTASPWQGTVGKMALGLQVVGLDGARLGLWRATGRYFAKIPSALILGIGFFMVGWTERKQGLHDMIAGTLVVKKGTMSQSSVF